MATQDYELLLRVRADLLEAISGLKGLTAQLGEGDVAAKSLGDSADTASAKIDQLSLSLRARDDAQSDAIAKTNAAALATKQSIKGYDDQVEAQQRATKAAEAYRAASSGSSSGALGSNAAVAGLQAEQAAMAKLVGQIDPTVAALAKLDAQEVALNALRKKGVVGLDDYTAYKAVIDKNRASITGAAEATEKFAFASAGAKREYGVLIGELARGNTARLEGSLTTLANRTGFLTLLFSPLGLAIGAVVGTLGLFAVAAYKGYEEEELLNKAIISTGNFAGVTGGEIDAMAAKVGNANGKVGQAREIFTGLVATGKFTSQSLGDVGQAAANMAQLTGKSAAQVVAEFSKIADDPVKAAGLLDEQYHFLTASLKLQIQTLVDEGNGYKALQLIAQTYTEQTGKRLDELRAHMSPVEKFLDRFSSDNGFSRLFDFAKNLGRPATELDTFRSALDKYNTSYQAYQNSLTNGASTSAQANLFSVAQKNYVALQSAQAAAKKVQKDAADEGQTKQDDAAGNAAVDHLTELAKGYDKVHDKQKLVKQLNADIALQYKQTGTLPAGVDETGNAKSPYDGVGYDYLLKKQLGESEKSPRAARPKSTKGVDDAAIAGQAELDKLLNDEQGAIDPVAHAWSVYNDQVTKATAAAAKAATGKKANITTINAERDAVIALYGKARDADIAKIADKDREAFEKLRDSLKDASGVSFGKLISQMAELKKAVANGSASPDEAKQTSADILTSNLPKLPEFKGADERATGPFGELDKLDDQKKKLDQAHAAQLKALDIWHQQNLDKDKLFYETQAKVDAEFADEKKKIEDAKQQVTLNGIVDGLDSAAQAVKEGFGAQSAAYRDALIVAKAAAVARATINLFNDVSEASAKGFPANIPLIAKAIADGESIISSITSVATSFSTGGYTGPGGVNQPAGVVHAGEVVWSQKDIARAGGVSTVEAMRLGMHGYADGGFAGSALASTAGFGSLSDNVSPAAQQAVTEQTAGPSQPLTIKHVAVWDKHEAAAQIASTPAFEQAVLNTVGRNPTTIKARWR